MAVDYEAIYAALNTRLQAVSGLTSPCSRRFLDLGKVPPDAQPAMFLVAGGGKIAQEKYLPGKRVFRPSVFVYARTDPETGSAPSTVLNPILKGIEAALEWQNTDGIGGQPGAPTTLGGLVSHCWVTDFEIAEGLDSGGQGVLIVNLEVLVAGA